MWFKGQKSSYRGASLETRRPVRKLHAIIQAEDGDVCRSRGKRIEVLG